jgi:NADP-dependent 3-hydroxy acid dehydrogenase YdfG
MKTRTFLVTGASKGIGRAHSHRLVDTGHRVVGIARGKDSTFPGELVTVDLDDDRAAAEALADMAKKHSFDGAVNNVGMAKLHRIGEINLADVEDMLRLNIHPTILTTQVILPALLKKK